MHQRKYSKDVAARVSTPKRIRAYTRATEDMNILECNGFSNIFTRSSFEKFKNQYPLALDTEK